MKCCCVGSVGCLSLENLPFHFYLPFTIMSTIKPPCKFRGVTNQYCVYSCLPKCLFCNLPQKKSIKVLSLPIKVFSSVVASNDMLIDSQNSYSQNTEWNDSGSFFRYVILRALNKIQYIIAKQTYGKCLTFPLQVKTFIIFIYGS